MKALVISGFGASMHLRSNHLIVRTRGDGNKMQVQEYRAHEVPFDTVVVDSRKGWVSLDAMVFCSKMGIGIIQLDWDGDVLYSCLPPGPDSNQLRLCQYQSHLDQQKRICIANVLVVEKIRQQHALLSELSRYYQFELPRIQMVSSSIKSLDLLRNAEARFAEQYFQCLSKVFGELGLDFSGRARGTNKHNMKSALPVSSALNYGYGLLYTLVRRVGNSIGLDSSIPFLHDLRKNREGLTYDLCESWRPLIDYCVVRLFESRDLKDCFVMTDDFECLLRPEATKRLISLVSDSFSEIVEYNSAMLTRERVMTLSFRNFANFLVGKNQSLNMGIPPISIKRDDSQDLKEKVLTHTARELGMSKSTHFYIRKRLQEGKSVRIYRKTKQYFA